MFLVYYMWHQRAVDEYGILSDEVPVAQWIERAPPERETAGSSPVGDVS